jgi:hypothetical protein
MMLITCDSNDDSNMIMANDNGNMMMAIMKPLAIISL